MGVILLIIGIIVAISIVINILKEIGDMIGKVIGVIVFVVLVIVAIRLLSSFLPWLFHGIHSLICLIPKIVLYGYIILYLATVAIWFVIRSSDVALINALEDVLSTKSYFGTAEELKKEVRDEILQNYFGILGFTANSQRYEEMFRSMLQKKCYKIKQRYCTYAVFEEFAGVLDSLGAATDKEMLQTIQSGQGYSLAVVEITKNLEELSYCLFYLVSKKRAELAPLNKDEYGVNDCYEPKLYISMNPSPAPQNMLPTVTYDWD